MPSSIERRLIRIPYIYDFDDAFYLKYRSDRFKMLSPFLGNKFDVVIREATKVIAGNDVIATYAKSYNNNIIVLPTVVDIQRYSTKQQNNNTFTIGWIGTPSTANYLKLIMSALEKITSNKQAIVRVVGSGPINLTNINHEIIPWTENTEIELLNSFDVGIMPLFDDQWAKGKCGYKLIQYMACKIPVIASPEGINTQIINHGQNGFLASSQEEWYESFMTLIESPELRDKMGLEGRKKVEQKYSLQVTAPKFIEIIQSVVS
jgi:glycosyltransferase involved in cell wall biosynthesis